MTKTGASVSALPYSSIDYRMAYHGSIPTKGYMPIVFFLKKRGGCRTEQDETGSEVESLVEHFEKTANLWAELAGWR
jgi:hypothetical protein